MPEPEAHLPKTDTRGNERPTSDAGDHVDSKPQASTADESKASHDESQASPQGKIQTKRRPSKQKQVETLDEFVQYAYSRNGQRLTLTKKVARLLNEGPSISEDVLNRVAELAETDVLFAVPRQILLAGLPQRSMSSLWARLQSVVNRAIDVHPCTRGLLVQPEEKNDDMDVDSAVNEALRRDCAQIRHPRTGKTLTKAHVKTLRMNVVYTLAVWMVARHRFDWRSVVRRLYAWIWEGEGDRVRTDADRLRAVTDVRQGNSAGLLCEAFIDEANEQRARAESAQRREDTARQRIEELQQQLAAKSASLSAHKEQIDRLEKDLSQTIAKHEAEMIHLRDDYERLRTRVLRRLKSELELLDEGLHAIRRTPPKVTVMEDHADRAVGGLRDEINALEAEARE